MSNIKSGIKTQTKSMFEGQLKRVKQSEFEQNVNNIERQKINYQNHLIDVMKKMNNVFNDKTLSENKLQFNLSLESEILDEFLKLIGDIDKDENQDISEGSLLGIGYLFKVILAQKDRLNKLEFELLKLKSESESK